MSFDGAYIHIASIIAFSMHKMQSVRMGRDLGGKLTLPQALGHTALPKPPSPPAQSCPVRFAMLRAPTLDGEFVQWYRWPSLMAVFLHFSSSLPIERPKTSSCRAPQNRQGQCTSLRTLSLKASRPQISNENSELRLAAMINVTLLHKIKYALTSPTQNGM